MRTFRASAAIALLALIGALNVAVAETVRSLCQADDAIPEFVTQRIELVSAVPARESRGAPAVELERDPVCHGGFRTEP